MGNLTQAQVAEFLDDFLAGLESRVDGGPPSDPAGPPTQLRR